MTTLRSPSEIRPGVLGRLDVARADTFTHAAIGVRGDTVGLRYDIDGMGSFVEEFEFHGLDVASAVERPEVAAALRLLHLTAGVSYLKAVLPPTVRSGPLDATTRPLLTALLSDGLGEFSYVNRLDLEGWFQLPEPVPDDVSPPRPSPRISSLDAGPLVPVGGGKDSIVTLEALRPLSPTLFAVNPRGPITRTIEAAGMAAVTVTRRLDPGLFELNDRGALNGHVPVTAIVSAAATVAAAIRGHDAVVMSNEASADEPTLTLDGRDVNHQWSKSSAFERLFGTAVRAHVHPDLAYVSFLRAASELAIAQRFAALGSYDAVFNSCNRAFHLRGATTEWCGQCPKCRFVFLALAPFMEPDRLTAVFGRDLLADADAVEGFAELAGLREHKPLECVGEEDESHAALQCLAARPAWRDHAVIAALRREVGEGCDALDAMLETGDPTALPTALAEAFRDTF